MGYVAAEARVAVVVGIGPRTAQATRAAGNAPSRRRSRARCPRGRAGWRSAPRGSGCRCRRSRGSAGEGRRGAGAPPGRPASRRRLHDLPARGPPHERIVDHRHPLALDGLAHGVQLHAHAHLAHGRGRLDERAAHVVVAREAVLQRHAGGDGVAEGRAVARVGHRRSRCRRATGRPAGDHARPCALRDHVHGVAEDLGVGPGEVDQLEDAVGTARGGARPDGQASRCGRSAPRIIDDLARLDLADVLGPGTGRARRSRRPPSPARPAPDHQGPEAVGVAHGARGCRRAS